jgi:hypothetical protein
MYMDSPHDLTRASCMCPALSQGTTPTDPDLSQTTVHKRDWGHKVAVYHIRPRSPPPLCADRTLARQKQNVSLPVTRAAMVLVLG